MAFEEGVDSIKRATVVCEFYQKRLEYLGHVNSAQGVEADQSKLEAMLRWPVPKNIKELRGFLGLTGYYRKFVSGYGKIAWALTKQLKKDQLGWNTAAKESFQQLKQAMVSVPVLTLPDFTKPFIIETDAPGAKLGVVLMQDQRPIAYYNHALPPQTRLKSIYEREPMAIDFTIQKWWPYLLGRRFIVRTYQKSLKFLLEQRLVSAEHQWWLTKLLAYDFEIRCHPGVESRAADALSRRPKIIQLATLSLAIVIHLGQMDFEVERMRRWERSSRI